MKLTKFDFPKSTVSGMFTITGRGNNHGMATILSESKGIVFVKWDKRLNTAKMTHNLSMCSWEQVQKLFNKNKAKAGRMKR